MTICDRKRHRRLAAAAVEHGVEGPEGPAVHGRRRALEGHLRGTRAVRAEGGCK